MRKAPKRYGNGGDINSKKLTPPQWKEKNQMDGNLPVNGPRPSVYPEYYDPKKWYQDVDKAGNIIDKPYISYTNPLKPLSVDPNHKAQDFSNPSLRYDANTGKYFNNVTGTEISPLIQQYKKGGKIKGYDTGGGVGTGYNERFNAVNAVNTNNNQTQAQQQNPNPYSKDKGLTNNQKLTALNLAGQGLNAIGGPQDTNMKYGSNAYFDTRNQQMQQGQGIANTVGSIPIVGAFKSIGEGGQNAIAKKDAYGVSDASGAAIVAGGFLNPLESTTSAFGDIKKGKFDETTAANLILPGVGQLMMNSEKKKERDRLSAGYKSQEELNAAGDQYWNNQSRIDNALAQRDAGNVNYNDGLGNPKNISSTVNFNKDAMNSNINDTGNAINDFQGKGLLGKLGTVANVGLGKKTFKDGGEIKGKGTGTSDEVEMSAEAGSFIVPRKNSTLAKKLRKDILGKTLSVAPKKMGETEIRASNGEHIFSKDEVNSLIEAGVDLDSLAPEAKDKLRDNLNCGGAIKGYAFGGEVDAEVKGDDKDFAKNERAKIESERRADVKRVGEIKAKQLADTKLRELNASIYKGLEKQLADKKSAEAVLKKNKTELDALKNSYDTYDKQSSEAMGRTSTSGEKLVGSSSRPAPESVRKEKEKLLKLIEDKQNSINEAQKKYDYSTNEKNYVATTKAATSGTMAADPYGISKQKEIPSRTGAEAAAAIKGDTSLGNTGTKNAVGSKSVSVPKASLTPDYMDRINMNQIDQPVATEPQLRGANALNGQPTIVDPASAQLSSNAAQTGNKGVNWDKIGGGLGNALSYGLPLAQAAIGYDQLRKQGPRPVGSLDQDFLQALNKSKLNATNADNNAKFGFSPEQDAMLRQQNNALTNNARYEARNLSGGSSAVALGLERAAANDSFGRNLSSRVNSNNLQLQKQQFAQNQQAQVNALTEAKQEANRRLFTDNLTGWKERQVGAGNLLSTGIGNALDAYRFNQFNKQLGNINNG